MAEAAFKPEKDFSKQVDELLPQTEQLAKARAPVSRYQDPTQRLTSL